jgi:hypothetical protein
MKKIITDELNNYFSGVLLMFINSVKEFPSKYWDEAKDKYYIWQHAYHTLYYVDLWMSKSYDDFKIYKGFDDDLHEMHIDESRVISKEKIIEYFEFVNLKCEKIFSELDDDKIIEEAFFFDKKVKYIKRILGQIRHVSVHIGLINGIMIKYNNKLTDWISGK